MCKIKDFAVYYYKVINVVFLVIIIIFLILFLIAAAYFFNLAFVRRENPNTDDIDSKENDFLDKYRPVIKEGLAFIEQSPKKWVYTLSFDGLMLAARFFDVNSDKAVILFHGYRSTANRDFSCAVKLYCELGYNVLLVDERSHGRSEGKLITYGVKERHDALSWINYYLKNIDSNAELFLGGMSMGATTVLLAAGLELPENVKGIIADCGFTSPVDIMKKVARQAFHFNADFLMPVMNIFCRIFGHFGIYGVSTVDSLKNTKIPVLFIHGKSDNFVPCEMSKAAYQSAAGDKYMITVEGADHGMSYLLDSKGVSEKMISFLEKYS